MATLRVRSAILQRFLKKDAEYVTPVDMLAELRDDNKQLGANLRKTRVAFATSMEMLPG